MRFKSCGHETFEARVDVNRFEDTGKFMAEVTIRCVTCGERMRFLGLKAGIAWNHPMVSIDETTLHAPIEPEGAPRLQAGASFEMPVIPKRH